MTAPAWPESPGFGLALGGLGLATHPSTGQHFKLRWNPATSAGTTPPLPLFRDVGATSSPTHLSAEDWLATMSDQQQAGQGTTNEE